MSHPPSQAGSWAGTPGGGELSFIKPVNTLAASGQLAHPVVGYLFTFCCLALEDNPLPNAYFF